MSLTWHFTLTDIYNNVLFISILIVLGWDYCWEGNSSSVSKMISHENLCRNAMLTIEKCLDFSWLEYYLYQSKGIFSATLMSLIWMILNVSLTWYTLTPLWRSISDVPQGLHLTGNHGPGKRLVAPATGLTEFRTRLWTRTRPLLGPGTDALKVGRGLNKLKPSRVEPPLYAATKWHRHTVGNSVKHTHLTP